MQYFFDTEFMEDGERIELISIGIVCEDGREYYAENSEADHRHANPWVQEHVLPHLTYTPGDSRTRIQIAQAILRFVGSDKPEFWAYYADYDWVVLCQLYGSMVNLPKGWPMYCKDVKQLADSMGNPQLPEQTGQEHNALEDARWTKYAYEWLSDWRVRAERQIDPIKTTLIHKGSCEMIHPTRTHDEWATLARSMREGFGEGRGE